MDLIGCPSNLHLPMIARSGPWAVTCANGLGAGRQRSAGAVRAATRPAHFDHVARTNVRLAATNWFWSIDENEHGAATTANRSSISVAEMGATSTGVRRSSQVSSAPPIVQRRRGPTVRSRWAATAATTSATPAASVTVGTWVSTARPITVAVAGSSDMSRA